MMSVRICRTDPTMLQGQRETLVNGLRAATDVCFQPCAILFWPPHDQLPLLLHADTTSNDSSLLLFRLAGHRRWHDRESTAA